MNMETVNDIIREIRFAAKMLNCVDRKEALNLADRLDAAYKRDMKAVVDANETNMKTVMDEVTRLQEENARFKAALKPVQDAHIPDFSICDTCRDRSECEKNEDSETCEWYDIVEAVRKSQTIYNGGEE